MFCTNCGKEIAEGMKFCPACGVPADAGEDSVAAGSVQGNFASAEPGIKVTGDFDRLRELMQKNAKLEKRLDWVGRILAVLWAVLMVRAFYESLIDWLDGSASGWIFVEDFAAMMLLASAGVYIFYNVCVPFMEKKKTLNTEECLACIQVGDAMALKRAVERMNCAAVKSVYLDENSNVCVKTRYKYVFLVREDGTLSLDGGNGKYKSLLEQESIALNLLKTLAPDAPVNAFEKEKRNRRLPVINRTAAVVFIVCFVAIIILGINPSLVEGNQKYISIVKDGHPAAYPDAAYGEAFDAFFSDCEWSYFKSTAQDDVVEFHGKCMYAGEETEVCMQFIVSLDEHSGELYTITLNGEAQPELMQAVILSVIFENYNSKEDKSVNNELEAMLDEDSVQAADLKEEVFEEVQVPESENVKLESEDYEKDMGNPLYNSELCFPILTQDLGFGECPVLVSVEKNGVIMLAEDYDDMLDYCVDDGITMYAPPSLRDGKIYTATWWDAPLDDWYNSPLTRDAFLDMVDLLAELYAEGIEQFDSTVAWEDVGMLSGRWDSGSAELSLSIFSDFSQACCQAEIGNWEMQGMDGNVYLCGKVDGEVWLLCESKSGALLQLLAGEDGSMTVLDAPAEFGLENGTVFYCVEQYVS